MSSKTTVWTLAILSVACGAYAGTVTDVTELNQTIAQTGHVYRAAAALESVEFPDDVGDPIFWLDCTETNGWEIAADGTVTKATSRVGSRYLTSTATRPFNGTFNNPYGKIKPPRIVADGELLAGPALDFGAAGSAQGLVFDLLNVEGCTASNVLYGIATVVAVYNAHEGGGFLMGGGGDGYRWHRGYSPWTRKSVTDVYGDIFDKWWNPIFLNHAPDAMRAGWFWHDGVKTDPGKVGFSGGWEVVATEPRTDLGLTTYPAFGLGLGDTRASQGHRSGGMKIAEMLIFDKQLSSEQLAKLDLYLDAKWLGRTRRGRNGRAVIDRLNTTTSSANTIRDDAPTTTVEVPEGQMLEIGQLKGGRCSCYANDAQIASLVKTGAGTLKVTDATTYSGEIVVDEGRLQFDALRPVPAELPFGAVMRFDASNDESIDTVDVDGEERVTMWRNSIDQTFKDAPIFLRALSEAGRPTRRQETVFGETRTVIDFGRVSAATNGGCFLEMATNAASPLLVTPSDLISVVYVIRPRQGGRVCFLGDRFVHGDSWDRSGLLANIDTMFNMAYNGKCLTWYTTNGVARVNGTKIGVGSGTGYDTLDYQVVTLQLPGVAAVRYLGRYGDSCGGFALAEAVFYNRLLTEREMADAEAYLSNKWLGRVPAGYARPDAADRTPDVQHIRGIGGEVYVAAGRTVRVGSISGTVVKTGEGILEVQQSTAAGSDMVLLKEGKVTYAAGDDPGAEKMKIARGPSLHLDAAAADTFEFAELNGTNFVRTWRSKAGGAAVYDYSSSRRPWVDMSAEKLKNGLPVVDFGAFGADGKMLTLDHPLDGVRSAFVVWDAEEGGGWLLGSINNGTCMRAASIYDFHRGIESDKTLGVDSQLFYASTPLGMVHKGEILTNGVPTTYTMIPARTMQLVEVHTLAGAHVSALACDRNLSGRFGGQRLGEVIIYERELSEREKAATRNYLMKKWFNREPEPLPPLSEVKSGGLAQYDVPVGETLEVADGVALSIAGGGTLAKTGAGVLETSNLSAFTGVVEVVNGALKLVGTAPGEGELVTEGRTFHFDASSAGLEVETNAARNVLLKAWRNLVDGSWTAEKGNHAAQTGVLDDAAPDIIPLGLNGMPVVDMKSYAGQYLVFKKDGVPSFIDNMHSVFWVFGSQNGGGYLMGGGTNVHNNMRYPWHRGYDNTIAKDNPGKGAGSHKAPLLHSSHAQAELHDGTASWYLNGQPVVAKSQGLSGEWDVISMVLPDECGNILNAQGFATDGRWLAGTIMPDNRGHQRLAEVIIYDRALSDAERVANENYLLHKWGVRTRASVTNGATVNLIGGVLDLGGVDQYVGALTGAGAVTNGNLTVGRLEADAAATAWPELDGAFIAPATLELEFANLATLGQLGGKHVKLMTAAAASGLAETTIIAFGDAIPMSITPRLFFNEGELDVAFRRTAMTIILK